MDVTVEIHCAACGSAHYSLPADDAEEGYLVCNDCSAPLGTLAELKAELLGQARLHSAEGLRDALAWLREEGKSGPA
ncbi:MAG: hypothetical protein ACT4OE_03775 [Sphingosinicella sp.]